MKIIVKEIMRNGITAVIRFQIRKSDLPNKKKINKTVGSLFNAKKSLPRITQP